MLLIPFFFRKVGIKWILILSIIAWILRFLFFGYGDAVSSEWMLYMAIILHGICYDFFFVAGQIYTDNKAGVAIKSQAQGLITLATYGIGMAIGSKLAGIVTDVYTVDAVKDWTAIWMIPAMIAGVVLLLVLIFFREGKKMNSNDIAIVS
jgi:MFS family permease